MRRPPFCKKVSDPNYWRRFDYHHLSVAAARGEGSNAERGGNRQVEIDCMKTIRGPFDANLARSPTRPAHSGLFRNPSNFNGLLHKLLLRAARGAGAEGPWQRYPKAAEIKGQMKTRRAQISPERRAPGWVNPLRDNSKVGPNRYSTTGFRGVEVDGK